MCLEPGCTKLPSYNVEGGSKRLYCKAHKKFGMVNIVKKATCLEPGCKTRPHYNVEGETPAQYCSKHKQEGMVDVVNRKCIEPGCNKIPKYSGEGETKRIYCSTHKKAGMVYVMSTICLEPGCKKIPCYNAEGETKGIYCCTHKKDGMINVTDKTCLEPGCKTRPYFNVSGETKAIYCNVHKKPGMVNVKCKRCHESGCNTQPIFNAEGETVGIYCSKHKKDCMVDVVNKTCQSEWCSTHVTKKYNGYCLHCYMHIFPDKPVTRNYKTKEFAVVEFVKSRFTELDWVYDKRVQDGCSRRRPDLLCDMGDQVLIVEVDENQHADYDCSCESKRLMELSQDVGHRPIVFIRFNPDAYACAATTKNMPSCWAVNKAGVCAVKKSKVREWEGRLDVLGKQVEYWAANRTTKMIEVVQLFFDEYS